MASMVASRPCSICGETKPNNFRIWFDGYVKLYKCLTCGFVSQFPGPGTSTIVTDYEDLYTLDFVKRGQEFMYPKRRRSLQNIVDRISAIKPSGKLLDVGNGDGHFLWLCAKQGFDCYGVESCKTLAEYAASKSGAQVVQGDYSRNMFPAEQFDIISFIQVVEHMTDPVATVEYVNYHLKPGGLLIIEIPSIRSPHFLAYRLTKVKWFVKPPDGVIHCHFGYYDPSTLQKLTRKCSFNTVSLSTGRWQHKYGGSLGSIGKMLDPFFEKSRIGGILLIAEKA